MCLNVRWRENFENSGYFDIVYLNRTLSRLTLVGALCDLSEVYVNLDINLYKVNKSQ